MADVDYTIPQFLDLPEAHRGLETPSARLARKWFFRGIEPRELGKPREGVDSRRAAGVIAEVLGDFRYQHEHKEAIAAFLIDRFFKVPAVPAGGGR